MAETTPVLKKKRIFVRGVGIEKREDFTEKTYKTLSDYCTTPEKYVEFVPVKKASAMKGADSKKGGDVLIPAKNWNKKQLVAFLTEKEVEFDPKTNNKDLFELCEPNHKWTVEEIKTWCERNQLEVKGETVEALIDELNS